VSKWLKIHIRSVSTRVQKLYKACDVIDGTDASIGTLVRNCFNHLSHQAIRTSRQWELGYPNFSSLPPKMSRCILEGVFTQIVYTTSFGGDKSVQLIDTLVHAM